VTERNSESQRELDSYRAYEMARDNSIPLGTIFKTTGGYRQGVVDARNAYSKKEDKKVIKSKTKKKTAKKTKTTRTTKMERLRIAAEENRPVGVRVVSEGCTSAWVVFVRTISTIPNPLHRPSTWTIRTTCESLHRLCLRQRIGLRVASERRRARIPERNDSESQQSTG